MALQDVATLDLKEPTGWIKTDLWHMGSNQQVVPLRVFCLQVCAQGLGSCYPGHSPAGTGLRQQSNAQTMHSGSVQACPPR